MNTPTTTPELADFEARYARASEALADPELWEATVRYSDGSPARTDFFMPGGSDENSAKQRAWTIWRLAKAGGTGEFLNPTLEVRLIVAAKGRQQVAA